MLQKFIHWRHFDGFAKFIPKNWHLRKRNTALMIEEHFAGSFPPG